MKDRRIWVIIGCILVVGIAITSYTSSVVKTPQESEIQVLSEDGAEKAVDTAAAEEPDGSQAPQAKMKETKALADAGVSEQAASKETVSKEAATEETVQEEAAALSADPVDHNQESYTDRLKNLDSQIQKMVEQETDSNVYSAKTSAETQLKMWDGELSVVYNALLEALPQEEALSLANEEKDWLKKRESDAADSSGKTGNSLSYASSMVNQTRERAYELAKRCDELAKKDEREDAVQ